MTRKGHEGTFWGDGNVLYLDRGLGYAGYAFVKSHRIVHLRFVPFIVCKFCLNKSMVKIKL